MYMADKLERRKPVDGHSIEGLEEMIKSILVFPRNANFPAGDPEVISKGERIANEIVRSGMDKDVLSQYMPSLLGYGTAFFESKFELFTEIFVHLFFPPEKRGLAEDYLKLVFAVPPDKPISQVTKGLEAVLTKFSATSLGALGWTQYINICASNLQTLTVTERSDYDYDLYNFLSAIGRIIGADMLQMIGEKRSFTRLYQSIFLVHVLEVTQNEIGKSLQDIIGDIGVKLVGNTFKGDMSAALNHLTMAMPGGENPFLKEFDKDNPFAALIRLLTGLSAVVYPDEFEA